MTACYDRFLQALSPSGGQDSADITNESNLLREINDIADELMIIDEIFTDQIQILDGIKKPCFMDELIGPESLENLMRAHKRVKKMQVQADTIYKLVWNYVVIP